MPGLDDKVESRKLDQIVSMLEGTQTEIRTIVEVTHKQAEMIDKQSDMIDKLWAHVKPVLDDRRRKEELKADLISKLLTGGIWSLGTGLLILIWQGARYYFNGGQ